MPQRPWLSSALSILVVLATAVALYRPDTADTLPGAPGGPALDGKLDRIDTPTELPANLPRPDARILTRPVQVGPPRDPCAAFRPGSPAPSVPPAPLSDPAAWWLDPAPLPEPER
jgi:hypothetical protein